MKSKMEGAKGEGKENSWIRAVYKMKNVRQNNKCVKECCSMGWLPSKQVTKEIV
jgi:hypothetical protein